ncbi:MAG TPA: DUF4397 domain-containing protein [Ignavibacteria bacterium]|nr:DUF4397 domain-containing protein [Ignavibacteria bacterium]
MKQNHFSKSLRSLIALSLCILTLSVFSGCNNDDDNPITPSLTSYVTVTHSSPNAPNVDILFGSTVVATNVPYLGTMQYKSVTGNSVVNLKINVTGTSTTVIDTAIYCQDGKSYTVFAYDSVSKIKPLVLTDDLTSPGSTNAKVRFIHLSPNAPTVDVGVTGKAIWFPFYSFGQYSSFRAVTGGTYTDLNVFLAGTPTLVYSVPNVTFTAGKIYTIVADGFAGSSFGLTVYPNN